MAYTQPSLSDVPSIVRQLTLDEKIQLVQGAGFVFPGQINQPEKVPGAAGFSTPIPRLSIPTVVFADGPAGIRINPERPDQSDRKFYATGFPIASLLAASWDEELLKKIGTAFGAEAKAYGVDFLLAPGMNIHRNPLGGRNFEYYSEDPLLSGKMAAGFVRGLQSEGVGATIKHFAANNQETNRMKLNTIAGERALREIYLKGFEIAIRESAPWAVMSAYNLINGVPASQREDLLTRILRQEWDYQGFVMTDWFAGTDAAAQLKAGNDLLMPGTQAQKADIRKAIEAGILTEEDLDRNVTHILNVYNQTLTFKGFQFQDDPDLKAHAAVAREAAAQGMVLLQNQDEALPLDPASGQIALFGVTSYATVAGGTGSGDVNKAYIVSIAEGLRAAGFSLNETLANTYGSYLEAEKPKLPAKAFPLEPDRLVPERIWLRTELEQIADQSEVAVFTLGRTSGEFEDRRLEGDFLLTAHEKALIRNLANVFHDRGKPLIVLLNTGGVIETASWRDQPDAILLVWQPGQEAGHAIADVLSGQVSPSGKLPVTFPIRYTDLPSSANFPGATLPADPSTPGGYAPPFLGTTPGEVSYEEGIFVGYRYFNSFHEPTAYPFGHGLSYTRFEYGDLQIRSVSDEEWSVSLEVTNTGQQAGREVVQLYISAPPGELDKPERELRAFRKTALLQPGEKQSVNFRLSAADLTSYHPGRSAWIAEAGRYRLQAGASSEDLRLMGSILLPEEKVVQDVQPALTPDTFIRELQLTPVKR